MRQMIGELARARQLTYRETSDKYGALIATARKDVSLASYQAVDDFETQTMRQADALMARLQESLLAAQRTKGELDALAARRKLQLIVVMTLGSTLLLAANLMSEKAPPQTEAPASSDEVAAAERLIELAMRQSKSISDGMTAETGETLTPRDEGARPLRSINRRRDRRGLDGPAESGGRHYNPLAGFHALDVHASSDLIGRTVFQCNSMPHHVDGLDFPGGLVRRFRRECSRSRAENCRGGHRVENLAHRHDFFLVSAHSRSSNTQLMADSWPRINFCRPLGFWTGSRNRPDDNILQKIRNQDELAL